MAINSENNIFNKAPFPETPGTKGAKKAREKAGKTADLPTTAAANPNIKDLKAALDQVDPQRNSEFFKKLVDQFSQVAMMIAFGGGGGGGGGGAAPPSAALKRSITDSLTGALAILEYNFGYDAVLNAFIRALVNDFTKPIVQGPGFQSLDPDYQQMVLMALVNMKVLLDTYGTRKIPLSVTPQVVVDTHAQVPIPIYGFAPDLYVQQYYSAELDPYPGYTQWLGPNGDYIYTVRGADEPPYANLLQRLYSEAEKGLAFDLESYIAYNNLTADILNQLLNKWCVGTQNTALNNTLGNNSSDNNNIANLIQMLGPILAQALNMAKQNHLPKSVLDSGKMQKALEKQTNKHKMAKKGKDQIKQGMATDDSGWAAAFPPGSPAAELTGNALKSSGVTTTATA